MHVCWFVLCVFIYLISYQHLAHSIHESYSEVRQFDRTKLSMQAIFIVFTTFKHTLLHHTRYLDKHNVEVSSAMIAEIEQTGSTHSSAEIKRKANIYSMVINANVLHNLLQRLFTEFLMVYGTLIQMSNHNGVKR